MGLPAGPIAAGPAPGARSIPPAPPHLGRDSLSVQVTSNTDSSRTSAPARAYQVTRSKVLSEGKPRERQREEEGQSELTGAASTEPRGQVQGEHCHLENKARVSVVHAPGLGAAAAGGGTWPPPSLLTTLTDDRGLASPRPGLRRQAGPLHTTLGRAVGPRS